MRPFRGRRWGILAAVACLLLAVYLLRVALWRPLAVSGQGPADGYARVAGVVHVHTTFSDGGGTPEEVIAAARASGLAFVAISDHNNLDARPLEGYHDGVLVLVGAELSTPAGHLLGLGLDHDPTFRFNGDGLDALEDVRDLGGVAFAAHPCSPRADLRFTGWNLPGPWGLEILNGDSEWRRARAGLLLTGVLYSLNPGYSLLTGLSRPDQALQRWDEMLARRDVVGIAGADAHSRLPLTKTRTLRFPSYRSLFSLERDHLLLRRPLSGDDSGDRTAILDAIRSGRFYMGVDALSSADAFGFTVEAESGERWTMGESAPLQPGLHAKAGGRVPSGTRLVLLRDGRPLAGADVPLDVRLPGAGVYRIEARVPGWPVPWILTNPIYVFDDAERERRRAAAAWPAPIVAKAIVPLHELPGTASFTPEADPSSRVDPAFAVPALGPGGEDGLLLAFRLGVPTKAQPFTWCALVNRQARDLRPYAGLHFRLKGDGEYRLWVQVRDVNPASADEGLEWWLASVRTSTDWREVLLPFSRFRTINRKTDGRLDTDQTRAIVFVLDGAGVKPGTQGKIWIAGVGVYR